MRLPIVVVVLTAVAAVPAVAAPRCPLVPDETGDVSKLYHPAYDLVSADPDRPRPGGRADAGVRARAAGPLRVLGAAAR